MPEMNKQSTTGSIHAAMPVTSAADALYSQIQGVFQQARQRAQAQRQPGHGAGLQAGGQTDRGAPRRAPAVRA